jgi:hypothetical protein
MRTRHSTQHLMTLSRVAAALVLLVAVLPAPAAAVQNPDSCGAGKGTSFTMPLPAGMRSPGVHQVDFRGVYTDAATGEVVDESIVNDITVDAGAPAYPGSVLVRLFRSTAIVNGEVIEVEAIRPNQDARLYVNVSWLKDDKFFVGPFRMFVSWESTPGTWSAYEEMPAGPAQSFCTELTKAIWKKGYGWS